MAINAALPLAFSMKQASVTTGHVVNRVAVHDLVNSTARRWCLSRATKSAMSGPVSTRSFCGCPGTDQTLDSRRCVARKRARTVRPEQVPGNVIYGPFSAGALAACFIQVGQIHGRVSAIEHDNSIPARKNRVRARSGNTGNPNLKVGNALLPRRRHRPERGSS